jgi:hypothetical protein
MFTKVCLLGFSGGRNIFTDTLRFLTEYIYFMNVGQPKPRKGQRRALLHLQKVRAEVLGELKIFD